MSLLGGPYAGVVATTLKVGGHRSDARVYA